ncbi:nucleotidyltransferase domain-containing protein [Clostridium sp. SHJSY1]|uniref:nucleotidyltransferase domain-containing protein n=1 Tax=Clostridium sp. SHJSY1 TaxID=2942483 RepID=UPI002877000E|nr:nucleotidyltransferase domain-containing protein [Clostridium sp. SHJSY1]MDS0525779.1 nucleotidyltransferase domain-containing protein [Clostridium sp. SHJSY1]
MNTKEIRDKLSSTEYDFLRTNEHLQDKIILLTTGGSHAYGTNIETSDLDIRGIAVEAPTEIIGLASFEQFENRETDTVIYGLRKVISLMLNCNPNVLEMLGTKEEHLFICNKYGKLLRDNVELFLSQKTIYSFGGYATAQLRRLQNALARDNYPQKDKEEHILSTIKSQLMTIEDRYKAINNGELNLFVKESEKENYDTEIYMNISLEEYPLRDFKNIYSEMSNVIRDYEKLNHRNSKKDELHLNKHAMHLIRLLIMGTELLEGKGINTYRENDIEFLMDIRKGKYSYEDIFSMVDEFEKKFKYASDNTTLPTKPNYNKVEEMIMEINKDVILNEYKN